jgi:hypothetical protein
MNSFEDELKTQPKAMWAEPRPPPTWKSQKANCLEKRVGVWVANQNLEF